MSHHFSPAKTHIVLLFAVILSCLLISCNSRSDQVIYSNEETALLERITLEKLNEFKKLDPSNFSTQAQYASRLFSINTFVHNSEALSNIVADSIHMFFDICRYVKIKFNEDQINSLLKNEKKLVDYKLSTYTCIGISEFLDNFKNYEFIFDRGKPIAVLKTNCPSTGNDAIIDFYFACMDPNNDFKVLIHGDTLKSMHEGKVEYRYQPSHKGLNTINAEFILERPLLNITCTYPLEYTFVVN